MIGLSCEENGWNREIHTHSGDSARSKMSYFFVSEDEEKSALKSLTGKQMMPKNTSDERVFRSHGREIATSSLRQIQILVVEILRVKVFQSAIPDTSHNTNHRATYSRRLWLGVYV